MAIGFSHIIGLGIAILVAYVVHKYIQKKIEKEVIVINEIKYPKGSGGGPRRSPGGNGGVGGDSGGIGIELPRESPNSDAPTIRNAESKYKLVIRKG